jgi:hypothetical protein
MAIRQVQVSFDTPRHFVTHVPPLGDHLTDMGRGQTRPLRKRPLGTEAGDLGQQILFSYRPDSNHPGIIAICYGQKEVQPPIFPAEFPFHLDCQPSDAADRRWSGNSKRVDLVIALYIDLRLIGAPSVLAVDFET